MVTKVPPGVYGSAQVEHFTVSEEESQFSWLRASMRPGARFDGVDPGNYVRLMVNGNLLMSDTHMERMTNLEVVRKAHGKVLIAGLGIGMILWPILAKKEVESVTVVEKNADVHTLMKDSLPKSDRLQIVSGDIFTWKPSVGTKYNVIYFDIWGSISTDTLKEMSTLHRRFARSLDRTDPKCWMDSWRREYLKDRRAMGR